MARLDMRSLSSSLCGPSAFKSSKAKLLAQCHELPTLHENRRRTVPSFRTCREVYLAEADDATYLEGEDAVLDADPFVSSEDSVFDDADIATDDPIAESEEAVVSDDSGAAIDVDKALWGQKALQVAQRVLQKQELSGLDLYSFRAVAKGAGLDVRLDKLEDKYGSPSMDEVEIFARAFYRELESELGEEEAGAITVEVSSPGANRQLQIPKELERFKDMPMSVTYRLEPGEEKSSNRILQYIETQQPEGDSLWKLAEVRANRQNAKGTKLTRKQAAQRFEIPLKSLLSVKLYVDF